MPNLNWNNINTVFLDMDGTLLDLHFDNYFWLTYLPQKYALANQITEAQAHQQLRPLFQEQEGGLNWYCTDFWTDKLSLPICQLKRECSEKIQLRPHVKFFLQALNKANKQVVLLTNAHRDSINIKFDKFNLAPYFTRIISSHDYGFAKEETFFWPTLQKNLNFDPTRSLFIDDNLAVLRQAKCFGISYLLSISHPDSKKGVNDTKEFYPIDNYRTLALNSMLN